MGYSEIFCPCDHRRDQWQKLRNYFMLNSTEHETYTAIKMLKFQPLYKPHTQLCLEK